MRVNYPSSSPMTTSMVVPAGGSVGDGGEYNTRSFFEVVPAKREELLFKQQQQTKKSTITYVAHLHKQPTSSSQREL